MQLIVLGRQPEISLAELESLFGIGNVETLGKQTALLKDNADISRLGGAIKIADVIHETTPKRHAKLAAELAKLMNEQDSKYNLGISWYGSDAKSAKALALEMKKLLKKRGHKVRVVPNQDSPLLSSAQIWHNRLDKEPNTELILAEDNGELIVAKTSQVQDIEAYAERDHGRPMRDAQIGMLPPKLAQIMVNLAAGTYFQNPQETNGYKEDASSGGNGTDVPRTSNGASDAVDAVSGGGAAGSASRQAATFLRILDPFCGTGVILQEAALMGYSTYGTDIKARMVDYTRKNMLDAGLKADLETADARTHKWQQPINAVVSETYLGPPFSSAPEKGKLDKLSEESGQLMTDFLNNIASQIESGTPLCLAVPVWFPDEGKPVRSTVVDPGKLLGYTRRSFKSAGNQDLIYRRPDQVVGRELLVLTRS